MHSPLTFAVSINGVPCCLGLLAKHHSSVHRASLAHAGQRNDDAASLSSTAGTAQVWGSALRLAHILGPFRPRRSTALCRRTVRRLCGLKRTPEPILILKDVPQARRYLRDRTDRDGFSEGETRRQTLESISPLVE